MTGYPLICRIIITAALTMVAESLEQRKMMREVTGEKYLTVFSFVVIRKESKLGFSYRVSLRRL